MDPGNLLELYELAIDEVHFYNESHHTRIAFYSGLVSALFTATAVGFFQASTPEEYIFVLVGPLLILGVSLVAVRAAFREHQRYLEAVTVRLKLEEALGLTNSAAHDTGGDRTGWTAEAVVPSRFLSNFRDFGASQAFVDAHLGKGLQGPAVMLFRGFQALGILTVVLLLYRVIAS